MKLIKYFRYCLVFILIGLSSCSVVKGEYEGAKKSSRPNLIIFFIDDMGYGDISSFGNAKVATPNIDRLASEGLKLTNFYVNSPICSASRVALKTGSYQQRERIHSFFASRKSNRNRKMPDFLPDSRYTYAKMFKENGYATAHFGKWHIGGGRDVDDAPLPQAYGYQQSLVAFEGLGDRILWSKTGNQKASWNLGQGEILDLPKHKTTETYVDRAISFIEENRDKPFLVNIFPNDVHDDHNPAKDNLSKWRGKGRHSYDDRFFAVLDEMDKQIGRVLNKLDETGLAENTIVIFTSDNGPTDWKRYYDRNIEPPGFAGPFRGRKWSLYEGGIRMPFLIRWPQKIKAGAINDTSIVMAMDLLPSLSSMLNMKISDDSIIDGLDMSEALLGKKQQRGKAVFWEYGIHGSIRPGGVIHQSPQLAMREGGLKLLMNADGSRSELYDLSTDIAESENLVTEMPVELEKMKKSLMAWWQEMDSYYDGY